MENKEVKQNEEEKKIVGTEKEEKKTEKKKMEEKKAKEKAVVHGRSLSISPKHSYSICKMIKRKTPEKAIEILESVLKMKKAVPMNDREVAHRKGVGMSSGRFPLNAAKAFIVLIKQLEANAIVNGVDNPIITFAKADRASRPYRREGRRSKRANVWLEVMDRTKLKNNRIKGNK